jgi:hypothetical protein
MPDYRWKNMTGHPINLRIEFYRHDFHTRAGTDNIGLRSGDWYPGAGADHFGASSSYAKVYVEGPPCTVPWDQENTWFGEGLEPGQDFVITAKGSRVGGVQVKDGYSTVYFDGQNLAQGEVRFIEVQDLISQYYYRFFVNGGDVAGQPVQLVLNGAGYGESRYRNLTNQSGWIGEPFMKDGDHVHI